MHTVLGRSGCAAAAVLPFGGVFFPLCGCRSESVQLLHQPVIVACDVREVSHGDFWSLSCTEDEFKLIARCHSCRTNVIATQTPCW
jgi:hypothetical protein